MSAPAIRHSSACVAARRHKHRRPQTRAERGTLDIRTPDVTARLLIEGVPAADITVVAAEVRRCIRFMHDVGLTFSTSACTRGRSNSSSATATSS